MDRSNQDAPDKNPDLIVIDEVHGLDGSAYRRLIEGKYAGTGRRLGLRPLTVTDEEWVKP